MRFQRDIIEDWLWTRLGFMQKRQQWWRQEKLVLNHPGSRISIDLLPYLLIRLLNPPILFWQGSAADHRSQTPITTPFHYPGPQVVYPLTPISQALYTFRAAYHSSKGFVELQVLDSVIEMTFVRCIEILVTEKMKCTYRHAHKETCVTKRPAG